MSDLNFTFEEDKNSSRILDQQLRDLGLSIEDVKKHAKRMADHIRSDAKKNINNQRTLHGAAFIPRKDRRKKTKMLLGLAKNIQTIVQSNDQGGAKVTWRNPLEAGIAGRHQWGIGEEWNAQKVKKIRGTPDYNAPCTLKQAKALVREGYRQQTRKGKPLLRMTVRDAQRTFTLGRAGLALRYMRTKTRIGKQSWLDTVPGRPFLGVSDKMVRELNELLAKKIMAEMFKKKGQ
jgi:phage gpG-like protein